MSATTARPVGKRLRGLRVGAVLAPVLGENPIAVAASTLIVAALFQPLRRRVQGSVDRRFNRARYDAERTTTGFADRLRDQVDLESVQTDLVATVDASLRPTVAGGLAARSRGAQPMIDRPTRSAKGPTGLGRRRAGVVWGVVGLDLAILVVTLVVGLFATSDTRELSIPVAAIGMLTMVAASFGAVGALLVTRRPGNPIGWILWAMALGTAIFVGSGTYAAISYSMRDGSLPATAFLAWLSGVVWMPCLIAVVVFVPMLFPDGRLLSRRWRWLVAFLVTTIGLSVPIAALAPGPLTNFPTVPNPYGIALAGSLADLGNLANTVGTAVALPMAVVAVVLRYRRGTPVERVQVKWFAAAVGLMASLLLVAASQQPVVADIGWIGGLLSLSLLPVAIGIAILRYRLYEIDRIVSRTISYLIVTVVLAVVFVGAILLFQALLAPVLGENPVAVAASTLIVAALFQPLRTRVQRIVDRRFNRSRYDADRIASAFSDRLRDEVDMTTLVGQLDATIRGAVAPASVGVWLREGIQGS